MARATQLKRTHAARDFDLAEAKVESAKGPQNEASGGPVADILAQLKRSLTEDAPRQTGSLTDSPPHENKWPRSRSLGVLFLGCSTFWLCVFAVVRVLT